MKPLILGDYWKLNSISSRLHRINRIAKGQNPKKGQVDDTMIEQARNTPILDIASPHLQRMRRSGKAFVSLCPLHNEKTPSFFVYPETNSCWCYGCGKGGDGISFVMLIHNFSFPEAVKYITNN